MPSMPVRNLDLGVLRSLKAYKIEKGMPAATAESWARAHLVEGVARVQSTLKLPANARDLEQGTQAAFAALKAWAQSTP